MTAQAVRQVLDGVDVMAVNMKAQTLALKHIPKLPEGATMLPLYKPMRFRKRRLGQYEIKTRRAEGEQPHCLDVVNLRYAFLLGLKALRVSFPPSVQFNWLYKGPDVLTSDTPVEIYQQYISFSRAEGHVLVGGLGLGMCAEMMLRLPKVKSVTVVEKEQDIIDLVQPQLDKRIKVVHADLYNYLAVEEITAGFYDFAYHDIWYTCGESAWAEYVVPLYQLSRKAGIQKLGAWGEWEMQAQLYPALYSRAMMPPEVSKWKPYAVFIDGCMKHFGYPPPYEDAAMPAIGKLMNLYLNKVGTPKWEETFDWDGQKGGGK